MPLKTVSMIMVLFQAFITLLVVLCPVTGQCGMVGSEGLAVGPVSDCCLSCAASSSVLVKARIPNAAPLQISVIESPLHEPALSLANHSRMLISPPYLQSVFLLEPRLRI